VQKIGWPDDDELIEYLDRATTLLTDRLITMRYNKLLKTLTLDGPTRLPEDFVTFMGKVPVKIVGFTATPYGWRDQKKYTNRWHDANIPVDSDRPMWGGRPLETEEDYKTWEELTKTQNLTTEYWSRLPFPSSFMLTDELPYEPHVNTLILDIARMFALNKNEYDLTQDMNIQQQIQSLMAQALGVVNEND
jgi:hypothetical protein